MWETNYTGDTRTLDVHVSWLRRAIELLCFAATLRDVTREAFLAAAGPEAEARILFNPYEVLP